MKLLSKEAPTQTKYTIEFDEDELYLLYKILGHTSSIERQKYGQKYGDLGDILYDQLCNLNLRK